MYPQFWYVPPILDTWYRGYCYMKYSYEYKRMCVELYRQGKWAETPDGIQKENFRKMIRGWARIENSCGSEALLHKKQNKEWTAEQRYELVAQVLAGRSIKETAYSAGINSGQLHQWVIRYTFRKSCVYVLETNFLTICIWYDTIKLCILPFETYIFDLVSYLKITVKTYRFRKLCRWKKRPLRAIIQ